MQAKKPQQNNTSLSSRQRSMYLNEIKKKLTIINGINKYRELYFKGTPVQLQVSGIGIFPTIVRLWAIVLTNRNEIKVSEGNDAWYFVENEPADDKVILALWERMCELEKEFKTNNLDKKIW